jgi:hypothetical protein
MIREIRLRYERDGDSIPPRCVIRSNHYSSQLSYFNKLFEAACFTYPNLQTEDCKVMQYGGRSYSGTFGLEFNPPEDCEELMPGWVAIPELEKTR